MIRQLRYYLSGAPSDQLIVYNLTDDLSINSPLSCGTNNINTPNFDCETGSGCGFIDVPFEDFMQVNPTLVTLDGDETKNLEFQEVYRTDKYDEQRGLEGVLYEKHKGTANQANGGLNKNKAIRDNHPKAEQYLDAADNYLKKNGND